MSHSAEGRDQNGTHAIPLTVDAVVSRDRGVDGSTTRVKTEVCLLSVTVTPLHQ